MNFFRTYRCSVGISPYLNVNAPMKKAYYSSEADVTSTDCKPLRVYGMGRIASNFK